MTKTTHNAAGAATRGKQGLGPKAPVAKQAAPALPAPSFLVQDLAECPLCIEPLDDTDRDFWPCSCGYQVCLFCYQRLQSEYNNTCPGCRQQYSDDLEGVRKHIARKQQQQAAEAAAAATARATGSGQHAGHHAGHHAAHHAAHHGHAAAAASNRAKAAAAGAGGAVGKQRQAHVDHSSMHPRTPMQVGSSGDGPSGASSGLPPTSNWVAAAGTAPGTPNAEQQQQQLEAPPPTSGDESAWPTLGAAQQQHKEPGAVHELRRRRSSSSSLTAVSLHQQAPNGRHDISVRSSFESIASTSHTGSSLHHTAGGASHHHQQQPDSNGDAAGSGQERDLSRASSGYTTVEVTTVVSGRRCSVCVPVSSHEHDAVEPLQEAVGLLSLLQQAVSARQVSSTEAAVQLVQCLRKLEAEGSNGNGSSVHGSWVQQVLAARNGNGSQPASARGAAAVRTPPPGFGHTPAAASARAAAAQQQPGDAGVAGWASAYRGGAAAANGGSGQHLHQHHHHQQQQPGETPQSSMHSVDSNSSLFSQGSSLSQSVWTDSGLPGADLGLGVARLSNGVGLAATAAAVPVRLQMHWAGANGGGATTGSTTAALPPGFAAGPPPGFGGAAAPAAGGGLSGSRLFNGSYNPLSFASAEAAAATSAGLPPGFGLGDVTQTPGLYRPFA